MKFKYCCYLFSCLACFIFAPVGMTLMLALVCTVGSISIPISDSIARPRALLWAKALSGYFSVVNLSAGPDIWCVASSQSGSKLSGLPFIHPVPSQTEEEVTSLFFPQCFSRLARWNLLQVILGNAVSVLSCVQHANDLCQLGLHVEPVSKVQFESELSAVYLFIVDERVKCIRPVVEHWFFWRHALHLVEHGWTCTLQIVAVIAVQGRSYQTTGARCAAFWRKR